jgi:hypothetical protein
LTVLADWLEAIAAAQETLLAAEELDDGDVVSALLELMEIFGPNAERAGPHEVGGMIGPPVMAALLDWLGRMLQGEKAMRGQAVPLTEDMRQWLGEARDQADQAREEIEERSARQRLRLFRNFATRSLEEDRVKPAQLEHQAQQLAKCRLNALEQVVLLVQAAIGPRSSAAPSGTVFRDLPEPWAPEMVVIPEGAFLMGSPEDEPERRDDEEPQHEVTVPRFALGIYKPGFPR